MYILQKPDFLDYISVWTQLVCVCCSDSSYLRRAGKAVFDAMLVADPSAIWSAYFLLLT